MNERSFPKLHSHEAAIDEVLVRTLVRTQFPRWRDLPLRRVATTGTDNAIFRLGDELGVRLPRTKSAAPQVDKEAEWLEGFRPHLPVPVPVPVARGEPAFGYPHRWLVYTWLRGTDLQRAPVADLTGVVRETAEFVRRLHETDLPANAPDAGRRGGTLAACDVETRWALAQLADEIDVTHATKVWEDALAAPAWTKRPVWVHGDLLPGNLIIDRGHLAGVIDWSAAGRGDPACDAMVAWSLPVRERHLYREILEIDGDTWTRARGWVVEQASLFIPYYSRTIPDAVEAARRRLHAALEDS
jgi:aminoglycoside phosphotransferase (APT) family kinase protein